MLGVATVHFGSELRHVRITEKYSTYRHCFLRTDALPFLGLALVVDIAMRDPSAIVYAGACDLANGASQLIQVAVEVS
jgi:hypothetical protein